jgi:hypothetical protein
LLRKSKWEDRNINSEKNILQQKASKALAKALNEHKVGQDVVFFEKE